MNSTIIIREGLCWAGPIPEDDIPESDDPSDTSIGTRWDLVRPGVQLGYRLSWGDVEESPAYLSLLDTRARLWRKYCRSDAAPDREYHVRRKCSPDVADFLLAGDGFRAGPGTPLGSSGWEPLFAQLVSDGYMRHHQHRYWWR